jgi:hypothetical protein
MVRPILTGSLGLLALLQPALAANPPAKTECQQNVDDHGAMYISPGSKSKYELTCNADHYGGDLDHVGSESFLGCSGVCDADPDCIGYAYTPGNCWLKKTYTRREVSTNVDFALNVQRNLTAAPYMAPPKPAPTTGSCGYYDDRDLPLGSKPNPDDRSPPSEYTYKCGRDHPEGDIGAVGAATFDSCVGLCDKAKDCVGFAWVGGNGPGTCYLKGRITAGEANSNVDFAIKRKAETATSIVASTSVVPSTSVVVSTSVSVVVPPPSSPPPPPTSEQAPPSSPIPETSSEPSIPVATMTETRTKWTRTGSSSIAVATVTKTRIIWTPTGFSTVPVKTASLPAPFSRSRSESEESQDESETTTSRKLPFSIVPIVKTTVSSGFSISIVPVKKTSSGLSFSVVPAKETSTSSSRRHRFSLPHFHHHSGSKTESADQTETITSVAIPTAFSTIPVPANATSKDSSGGIIVPPFVLPPPKGVWDPKDLPVDAPMPTDSAGNSDIFGKGPADPGPRPGVGWPWAVVDPFGLFGKGREARPWHWGKKHHFWNPIGRVAATGSSGASASGAEEEANAESDSNAEEEANAESESNAGSESNAVSESNATATAHATAAPSLAIKPFRERLVSSATITSSIAPSKTGFWQRLGLAATTTSSIAETTSSEEPKITYISAPLINRPIPTLDVSNGYHGGRGFGGISGAAATSDSDDSPEETTVAALPMVATPKPEPSKTPCQILHEKGTKKLRTRLVKGNKDFDGLYLEPWKPAPAPPGRCSDDGFGGGCRKSTIHLPSPLKKNQKTNSFIGKSRPKGSLFLTKNAASAGSYFVQPRDGIVATWAEDAAGDEQNCHYYGMKLIPHEDRSALRRNVQGMLDFEENGGTGGMVGPEGGKLEPKGDDFKSFAVCKARQEQHFTPKERENEPLLQFWQGRQKNKLGKRCALVEVEMVDE